MIGSEAREALQENLRGQRNQMLQEHQVLFQAGGREKEFVRSQMHAELQSQVVSFRRVLQNREAQQEHISQSLSTCGTQ